MGKIIKQDEDESMGLGVKKCLSCGKTMPYGILDHIANNINCEVHYFKKKKDEESSNPEKVSKKDLEKEAEAKSETGPEKNTDTTTKLFEILQSAPKDNPSLGPETDSESESYLNEEEIYELISEEIESSSTKKGLWTKAFSESEGDEQKAKALYIKYRFDQIKQTQPQVDEENIVKDNKEKVAEEKVTNDYKIKLSDRVIKEEKSSEHYGSGQPSEKSLEHYDSGQPPEKFGGFLLFLAYLMPIALFLSPLAFLAQWGQGMEAFKGANSVIRIAFQKFFNGELIHYICLTLFCLYLMYSFYKKKRFFPMLYTWMVIVSTIISYSLGWQFIQVVASYSSKFHASDLFWKVITEPKSLMIFLPRLAILFYLHSSTRVKKTFTQ